VSSGLLVGPVFFNIKKRGLVLVKPVQRDSSPLLVV
jgi:hypothetical protein